jgi:AraC family transcriptional activator of pobA
MYLPLLTVNNCLRVNILLNSPDKIRVIINADFVTIVLIMKHFKTLGDLHRSNGFAPPENPLLSFIRCTHSCSIAETEFTTDFYMIGFKKMISGTFLYGRTRYDHDGGSMSFVKPRQVVEMHDLRFEDNGYMLYFHEDFIN